MPMLEFGFTIRTFMHVQSLPYLSLIRGPFSPYRTVQENFLSKIPLAVAV